MSSVYENALMSNSGTATSFFALFIRLPNPVRFAMISASAATSLTDCDIGCSSIVVRGTGPGDVGRVVGRLGISMSISNEERRTRSVPPKERRGTDGDGVRSFRFSPAAFAEWSSKAWVESLFGGAMYVKDQCNTRSSARPWQPIRQNTRAICSTKLNSVRPEISLEPLTV